jgi:predicted negative regulator of RcsB-dependent stress response
MAKFPEATEMKKNINVMISRQATSAKHAASKNAKALVQFKLDAANEALDQATTTPNHEKYKAIIK